MVSLHLVSLGNKLLQMHYPTNLDNLSYLTGVTSRAVDYLSLQLRGP